MIGLREKRYLGVARKRFDPITVFASVALLVAVLVNAIGFQSGSEDSLMFNDFRSFFFVVGGTVGVLLFQFDLETFLHTFWLVIKSFISNPVRHLNPAIQELDEAIIKGDSILELRNGDQIEGELLNDVVHMVRQKLFYEEIEDFVSNRVSTIFMDRKVAVSLLDRGARIAPALGLLGTVIGLIEVLQSLEEPSKIGPAMSLALMTTAFGSVLGSLFFTPLAGRLEHHNIMYVETHKQLMNRVALLIKREDRRLHPGESNKTLSAA